MSKQRYKTIDQCVGGTPLVRLQRLNPNPSNIILGKLEGNNPAGSVKDRAALKMISEAEKLDIYDNLIVGDIVETLSSSQEKIDLFVALDVLIYIGDALLTFQAVRECCKPDSLFAFSVEIQEESGYSLLKSARYAHSDKYIMEQTSGIFDLVASQTVRLRKEGDNGINGKVYVFRAI